jgi:glutathione S-transferase
MTEAKLYVILGSHACRTGMLLLEHKRIPYRLVTLPTGLHPVALRLLGVSGNESGFRRAGARRTGFLRIADRLGTVPTLRLNGTEVKTNLRISRFLERHRPEPPLFPSDPGLRAEVERAEAWGDQVLQMAARRLAAACRDIVGGGDEGRLGPLLWHSRTVRRIGMGLVRQAFAASRRADEELLPELPSMLDRVDGWSESGVLNGERPNAADLMIAPSLALLTYRPDTRIEIERRPLLRLVDRLLPEPSGTAPPQGQR